jgi:hypothetical protein
MFFKDAFALFEFPFQDRAEPVSYSLLEIYFGLISD